MKFPGIQYESPCVFTLRQRIVLAALPPLIAGFYRALARTCRFEFRGRSYLEETEAHGKVILPIWHETLGLGVFAFRNSNYHSMTSYSFDGELATRIINCFGIEAVRGSSSRGGSDALFNLAKALEHVSVGFTLDGPRGPRRRAKPGIAILAARTQTPVVPLAFAVDRCWRLRSWDRFPVPKPFARVLGACGPPIAPPPDDAAATVELARREIETRLNELHETLERELCGAPVFVPPEPSGESKTPGTA